jgi:GNAT superfamily N-acetyltransferase
MALDYQITAPLDDSRVVLTARDREGALLGGLVGIRFWNGLFVDLVWVAESHRKHGIGKDLMNRAETELKTHGGEVVFPSTWSFQAPGFYEKLGYKPFGTFENMRQGF